MSEEWVIEGERINEREKEWKKRIPGMSVNARHVFFLPFVSRTRTNASFHSLLLFLSSFSFLRLVLVLHLIEYLLLAENPDYWLLLVWKQKNWKREGRERGKDTNSWWEGKEERGRTRGSGRMEGMEKKIGGMRWRVRVEGMRMRGKGMSIWGGWKSDVCWGRERDLDRYSFLPKIHESVILSLLSFYFLSRSASLTHCFSLHPEMTEWMSEEKEQRFIERENENDGFGWEKI